MRAIREVLESLGVEEPLVRSESELEARERVLLVMFEAFGGNDPDAVERMIDATLDIPLDKLALGVRALLDSHAWPRLPYPAEVRDAAKIAAGMHRERYLAGRYLPPARDWPPLGRSWSIQAGETERVRPALTLGPGDVGGLLEAGE